MSLTDRLAGSQFREWKISPDHCQNGDCLVRITAPTFTAWGAITFCSQICADSVNAESLRQYDREKAHAFRRMQHEFEI